MDELIKISRAIADRVNTGSANGLNTVTLLSQTATLTAFKSGAGVLHKVAIASSSHPTLTIYDNASGASGTILAHFDGNFPVGMYVVDLSYIVGLSAWITGGNAIRTNVHTH